MALQVSIDHHSVPRLILRPWLVDEANGQRHLHGYWWDAEAGKLRCRERGLSGFCVHRNLLTLNHHKSGADALERIFFREIDDKGAKVRDILLNDGPDALDAEQRSVFARLLLSMEMRRPDIVQRLRDGRNKLADGLDTDAVIVQEMGKMGLQMLPSELAESRFSLEDRALLIIQSLVDNKELGQRLINARWGVRRIAPQDGRLVLADRPCIRRGDYDNQRALWYLPLTPSAAFVAVDQPEHLRAIMRVTGQRFAKVCNADSTRWADRFVFSTVPSDATWIETILRKKHWLARLP